MFDVQHKDQFGIIIIMYSEGLFKRSMRNLHFSGDGTFNLLE